MGSTWLGSAFPGEPLVPRGCWTFYETGKPLVGSALRSSAKTDQSKQRLVPHYYKQQPCQCFITVLQSNVDTRHIEDAGLGNCFAFSYS